MESPRVSVNPNYYLAFDPGGTSGWASFDKDANLTGTGDILGGMEGLSLFLATIEDMPHTIICETYEILPWVPHAFSRVETIREVGIIQEFALRHNIEFIEQKPMVKKSGRKWAGLAPDKNKADSHHKDAIGHGVYFLYKVKRLWVIRLLEAPRRPSASPPPTGGGAGVCVRR